jgi:hypothetical protein
MAHRKVFMFALLVITTLLAITTGSRHSFSQIDDPLPPHVIDVWPVAGVEMLPDEPLTITFDQPMDRSSVESPLNFSPEVHAQYSWVDSQTLNVNPIDG